MLAVERLIRIEFSIDVTLPFALAAGILITGFPPQMITRCNEIKFMLPEHTLKVGFLYLNW